MSLIMFSFNINIEFVETLDTSVIEEKGIRTLPVENNKVDQSEVGRLGDKYDYVLE